MIGKIKDGISKVCARKTISGCKFRMQASLITSSILILVLLVQSAAPAFACGPGYVTPIFDYKHAPENPFENFAAGRIGIIKPTYRRIVLYAAYRYLNGGGFSPDEQKALVEVWNAEFNNKPFENEEDLNKAVRNWVEKRKEVFKNEETLPSIYTEREYGGYDFFPNCTISAFETATQTLSERIGSYGAEDKNVQDWLRAQDQVFMNCSSGQSLPEPASPETPVWLKKDREYQLAAANFYSLNFETARKIWSGIAEDSDSVWAETADYLIARTLVREASLSNNEKKANDNYAQAEKHLERLLTKGGRFYNASLKLMNLIKYRIHPETRVRELAQLLSMPGASGENFRQDFIDYSWLLDKFEKQALVAEEQRKEELKKQAEQQDPDPNANVNSANLANSANFAVSGTTNLNTNIQSNSTNSNTSNYSYEQIQTGEAISFYLEGRSFIFPASKPDEEIYREVETQAGRALTDKDKETIQEARRLGYRNKTTNRTFQDYQGGYYGTEKTSLSILPEFLRQDDLTDWLFAFQIKDSDAYQYAFSRWRDNQTDLWLMTALSRAETNSPELKRLLLEAEAVDRSSLAYPTIAYHTARLYIALGRRTEARRLLHDILNSTLDLPISSRNQFLAMRMQLAGTLDEFLKFAQRKPFAFDFDGKAGTIDELIAEQKSWYDPKYYTEQTREEYEREVEERFQKEREWQDRLMFDEDVIEIMDQHFPLTVLLQAQRSPALPEYLQKRLATAIWVRAVLLDDDLTARKISPEFLRLAPEFAPLFEQYQKTLTVLDRKRAALFLIAKNPILTPYVESGMGKTDNEFYEFGADNWWCEPYDLEYDEESGQEIPRTLPERPAFLSRAQTDAAQAERARLKKIGDAPKFLGETVLAWQKQAPQDKRIPELLYIAYQANGWNKYGCGNNEELRRKIGDVLRKRYPKSDWTGKLIEEDKQNQ